jgi:hypothetical protein
VFETRRGNILYLVMYVSVYMSNYAILYESIYDAVLLRPCRPNNIYPDIGRTLAEQTARQKDIRDATHCSVSLF